MSMDARMEALSIDEETAAELTQARTNVRDLQRTVIALRDALEQARG